MGGGVCNMYTGTLVDVINEATIKAPDRPVAHIHRFINARAADFNRTGMNQQQIMKTKPREEQNIIRQLGGTSQGREIYKRMLRQKTLPSSQPGKDISENERRFVNSRK